MIELNASLGNPFLRLAHNLIAPLLVVQGCPICNCISPHFQCLVSCSCMSCCKPLGDSHYSSPVLFVTLLDLLDISELFGALSGSVTLSRCLVHTWLAEIWPMMSGHALHLSYNVSAWVRVVTSYWKEGLQNSLAVCAASVALSWWNSFTFFFFFLDGFPICLQHLSFADCQCWLGSHGDWLSLFSIILPCVPFLKLCSLTRASLPMEMIVLVCP